MLTIFAPISIVWNDPKYAFEVENEVNCWTHSAPWYRVFIGNFKQAVVCFVGRHNKHDHF